MMEKAKSTFKFLLPYLKNKYVIASFAFLIWMTFFDNNNFISQFSSRSKLSQLKADKEYYITEIDQNMENLNELMTNKKTLEKFAREKYLMKKPDEEIFIFVEKEE